MPCSGPCEVRVILSGVIFHLIRTLFFLQKAYREEGKKEAGHCLYAQMPQTIETVFAKEVTKAQSDVSPRHKKPSLHLSFIQLINAV